MFVSPSVRSMSPESRAYTLPTQFTCTAHTHTHTHHLHAQFTHTHTHTLSIHAPPAQPHTDTSFTQEVSCMYLLTRLLAGKTSSSLSFPDSSFPNTPALMMSLEYLWNCSKGRDATDALILLATSRQANPMKSGTEKSWASESGFPFSTYRGAGHSERLASHQGTHTHTQACMHTHTHSGLLTLICNSV